MSKAVETAGYSVVQTAASMVDSKGWPLAASMAARSVALKASTWAVCWAQTLAGSRVGWMAVHWAASKADAWAVTMAALTAEY